MVKFVVTGNFSKCYYKKTSTKYIYLYNSKYEKNNSKQLLKANVGIGSAHALKDADLKHCSCGMVLYFE